MNQLIFSSKFDRQLKKIVRQNPKLKNKRRKIFKLLIKDASAPSLRLHKLSGEGNWSILVTPKIRIIARFKGKKIFCLQIGSHDEVY